MKVVEQGKCGLKFPKTHIHYTQVSNRTRLTQLRDIRRQILRFFFIRFRNVFWGVPVENTARSNNISAILRDTPSDVHFSGAPDLKKVIVIYFETERCRSVNGLRSSILVDQ